MSIAATDQLAKRNAAVFATAQTIGGATHSIVIASGGLVGQYLAHNPAFSTLPVSITQLGLALSTLPAAFLARRVGRRLTSILGMLSGAVCGALAAFAIVRGSFALFCLAALLVGFNAATLQQYRFAVADAATPALKARVISWVMVGGVFSAVIGPQTAIWTRDLLAPIPFAGVFVGHMALALVCALVLTRLVDTAPATVSAAGGGPARPRGEILRQPRLQAAIVCGVVSYGLMSFGMTAAPIAIVDCGFTPGEAWLGVQWHILGMFAPSLFTGRLIDRFGKEKVTAAGLLLLAASATTALMGTESLAHFWTSLTLLGVGWNFAFIGATAMVTDCYRPSERALVQSVNDFAVFGTVAIASFASGQILNSGGWAMVNWIMFPALALAALALLVSAWVRMKTA